MHFSRFFGDKKNPYPIFCFSYYTTSPMVSSPDLSHLFLWRLRRRRGNWVKQKRGKLCSLSCKGQQQGLFPQTSYYTERISHVSKISREVAKVCPFRWREIEKERKSDFTIKSYFLKRKYLKKIKCLIFIFYGEIECSPALKKRLRQKRAMSDPR